LLRRRFEQKAPAKETGRPSKAFSQPLPPSPGRSFGAGSGYCWLRQWRWRHDLAIFDAMVIENGPIAIAELAHLGPLGFHGNWRSRD
jgi:hypothetical protein